MWLRTWITDIRYVDPMIWSLETKRIDIRSVPDWAFANDDERARVTGLLDQYNNSDPDHPIKPDADQQKSGDTDDDSGGDGDEQAGTESDNEEHTDDAQAQDEELDLKLSPEVDAEFAAIAKERIERDPTKYYMVLPATRMMNMWFDTHSEYYSFAGELFPLKDLDSETYQNLWLPLFAGIVWLYTILAFAGALVMLFSRWRDARIFLLMTMLIFLPRAIFISTLENPEPRYFVEYFLFAAVLAGIAMSGLSIRFGKGRVSISLLYGK
jgi:hypothetical protein